jgi:hypothetical protein
MWDGGGDGAALVVVLSIWPVCVIHQLWWWCEGAGGPDAVDLAAELLLR